MGKFREKIIGYFPGAWDLIHVGHVMALEEAKKQCDYLIIGLGENPQIGNSDKNKPIMSLEERYKILKANKFVDAIIVYNTEYDSLSLDEWLPVDIRFMGEDHRKDKKYPTRAKKIIYISRNHNYSSSWLRDKIKNA